MQDISVDIVLICTDNFILMKFKQINAIEFINIFELIREFCIKNNKDTGNTHNICNQINKLGKFIGIDFTVITNEEINELGLFIQLTLIGECLGNYNKKTIKNFRVNHLDLGSIDKTKACSFQKEEYII